MTDDIGRVYSADPSDVARDVVATLRATKEATSKTATNRMAVKKPARKRRST